MKIRACLLWRLKPQHVRCISLWMWWVSHREAINSVEQSSLHRRLMSNKLTFVELYRLNNFNSPTIYCSAPQWDRESAATAHWFGRFSCVDFPRMILRQGKMSQIRCCVVIRLSSVFDFSVCHLSCRWRWLMAPCWGWWEFSALNCEWWDCLVAWRFCRSLWWLSCPKKDGHIFM